MRTGKELIAASKEFACENRLRSWAEVLFTIVLAGVFLVATALTFIPSWGHIIMSIAAGLTYMRIFVIYHDYQHRAILQRSQVAEWLMKLVGIYMLAPETIWKRTHEHHHNNNSKLTISGIGSYPTVSKERFKSLTKSERRIYLINRHPLTILLGYFTLFTYWLNLKSFVQSPSKHMDSLASLLLHWGMGFATYYYLGFEAFILVWWLPFFIAFSMGSYLFYSQHNFPGAKFRENKDWSYDNAALASTSFMKMNPIMHWFTADIAYHHVHHLNSRIPFYRLREAMKSMPELKNVAKTSLSPVDMWKCFRLKVWDPEKEEMITLRQM
ncbi:MAG: fatty acid desaturase [Cyclobacteriaceae bacterium]|nr:fatty acid desaturase [Cyclobacteriaceae bacterium]